jgi:hypothetical protein
MIIQIFWTDTQFHELPHCLVHFEIVQWDSFLGNRFQYIHNTIHSDKKFIKL